MPWNPVCLWCLDKSKAKLSFLFLQDQRELNKQLLKEKWGAGEMNCCIFKCVIFIHCHSELWDRFDLTAQYSFIWNFFLISFLRAIPAVHWWWFTCGHWHFFIHTSVQHDSKKHQLWQISAQRETPLRASCVQSSRNYLSFCFCSVISVWLVLFAWEL